VLSRRSSAMGASQRTLAATTPGCSRGSPPGARRPPACALPSCRRAVTPTPGFGSGSPAASGLHRGCVGVSAAVYANRGFELRAAWPIVVQKSSGSYRDGRAVRDGVPGRVFWHRQPAEAAVQGGWSAGRGTCAARRRGGSGATRRHASGGPSMASTRHVPRPSTMAPVSRSMGGIMRSAGLDRSTTGTARSVAPLCPACRAAAAAGHHGCAQACQAPISNACSKHIGFFGIA